MKSVVLYAPINRELLEEVFISSAVAMSYRKLYHNVYALEMRDPSIFRKYNQPHAVIDLADYKQEVERKVAKH